MLRSYWRSNVARLDHVRCYSARDAVLSLVSLILSTAATLARPAPTPQKLRLFKSTVKPRTLNPVWVESEIPRLPLRVSSSAHLKRAHLFVVVMDRDVAGDDRMGAWSELCELA